MTAILITGGTGLIGSALVSRLCSSGHPCTILSRNPEKHKKNVPAGTTVIKDLSEIPLNTQFLGVINLAGTPIGDKRWSDARKKNLYSSRVTLTRELISFLGQLHNRPEFLISGSAIGYYGSRDDADNSPLNENSPPVDDFTHQLCAEWEKAAMNATEYGIRTCIIRTGVVLAREGGMLKKLFPAFFMGLGGKIGSGKQTLSWIHIKDMVDTILFLINHRETSGTYNITSPESTTNEEFTSSFSRTLNRPAFLPLPAPLVRLLFGEMGNALLLKGQNVYPQRLLDAGFIFRHPTLDEALLDIFR